MIFTPAQVETHGLAHVIKMSETLTAHAGSKHLRIAQAFIHDEAREGLVKCLKTACDENGRFLHKVTDLPKAQERHAQDME